MGIVNNTYFKNEIYIAHAKPGIADAVTEVESKVNDFINEYEQDCLIKSLGVLLANEFFSKLDSSRPNFIKEGEDAKWDELLNGKTYEKEGKTVVWKGIRIKSKSLGDELQGGLPDVSFLANYIYFFYESNFFITRGNAGSGSNKSANMETIVPNQKVVKAWNKFVQMVQGGVFNSSYPNFEGNYFEKEGRFGGLGVSFYNEDEMLNVPMYKFISDMNELLEGAYADFSPKQWSFMNQFGI